MTGILYDYLLHPILFKNDSLCVKQSSFHVLHALNTFDLFRRMLDGSINGQMIRSLMQNHAWVTNQWIGEAQEGLIRELCIVCTMHCAPCRNRVINSCIHNAPILWDTHSYYLFVNCNVKTEKESHFKPIWKYVPMYHTYVH